MEFAFSSNAYLKYPIREAIDRIADLGYTGIELMADVPHAWPTGITEYQVGAIRKDLDRRSLRISNINAFMMNAISDDRQPYWHPSWLERDLHYRRVRINHTLRALTLARDLGAPGITTEPGGPLDAGMTRPEAITTFVEGLKPVADHAAKLGVQLLIEPEPQLLIETSDQYLELIERIAAPAIGLNFDIGHFYCVGEEPGPTIRKLAPHIRHFHLEDIAASRVHHHLVPGEGAIDFVAAFAAMRQIGYDGWVTVELYPYVIDPDTAARTALASIRRAAEAAGVTVRSEPLAEARPEHDDRSARPAAG